MQDPIVVYHPDLGGATATVEREFYRSDMYSQGWRSAQDPYPTGGRTPGTELAYALLNFDAGTVNGNSAPIEFSTNLRIVVPELEQPIYLEFWGQLASVTSASTFSVGFIRTSELGSLIAFKSLRQYTSVPTASAAIGIPILLRHRLDPGHPASTWTLAGIRDSGTGSGQVKGNDLYAGGIRAVAA